MEKIADLQFYEAILRPGEQSTGRVTHHYGPSLTIAEVHPGYVPMTEEEVDQLEAGLDRVGQLGLAAFRHRQSEAFRKSKEARRHDGVAWNDKTIPGLQTPVRIDRKPFSRLYRHAHQFTTARHRGRWYRDRFRPWCIGIHPGRAGQY